MAGTEILKGKPESITIITIVYQLSKAGTNFGNEVLDLTLRCCQGQLSAFPIVTISWPAISRALLPMTSSRQVATGNGAS